MYDDQNQTIDPKLAAEIRARQQNIIMPDEDPAEANICIGCE